MIELYKIIDKKLEDREFERHIDELELASFIDDKLDNEQKEEIVEHLIYCKRCRDIVKEVREEKRQKKTLIRVIIAPLMVASILSIIFIPPIIYPLEMKNIDDEIGFKGKIMTQESENIFTKTIKWWRDKIGKE